MTHQETEVSQMAKNLPAVLETWVQSLGGEDAPEKEMAAHSSTLAWRIPWTQEPDRLQFMGSQRVGHNRATNTHITTGKPSNLIDQNQQVERAERKEALLMPKIPYLSCKVVNRYY